MSESRQSERPEQLPPVPFEELLKELGENTPMYVGESSLVRGGAFIDGFLVGRSGYANDEISQWCRFVDWLRHKFQDKRNVHWPAILLDKYPNEREAITQLHPLYQEFLKKQKRHQKTE